LPPGSPLLPTQQIILDALLVKAGQVEAARVVYANAKYAQSYSSWPYRSELEAVASSDLYARAALYANNDPSTILRSAFRTVAVLTATRWFQKLPRGVWPNQFISRARRAMIHIVQAIKIQLWQRQIVKVAGSVKAAHQQNHDLYAGKNK
jgi:hypothetical protein